VQESIIVIQDQTINPKVNHDVLDVILSDHKINDFYEQREFISKLNTKKNSKTPQIDQNKQVLTEKYRSKFNQNSKTAADMPPVRAFNEDVRFYKEL
jgi:hypothetical protein